MFFVNKTIIKGLKTLIKRKIVLIQIILIIIIGFVIYANSLNGKFIWDDEFLIKDNASIKDW